MMTDRDCGRIYLKGLDERVLPGFLNTPCTETALSILKEKNTGKVTGQSGGCFFLLVDCTNKLGDTLQFMKDLLELVKADKSFAVPSFCVCSGETDPNDLGPVEGELLIKLIALREEIIQANLNRYLPENYIASTFLAKRCKFTNDPVRIRS